MGRHAAGDLSLRDVALPVMEDLRHRTDETIHLAIPDGDEVVLIERLETTKPAPAPWPARRRRRSVPR